MTKSKMIYFSSLTIIVFIIVFNMNSPETPLKKVELKLEQKTNKQVQPDPKATFVQAGDLHSKLIQTFRESLLNTDYEMAFYTFEEHLVEDLYSSEDELQEDTLKQGFRSSELHGSEHKHLHPRLDDTVQKLTRNKTLTNIEINEIKDESKYNLYFIYGSQKVSVNLTINPNSHLIATSPKEIIKQIEK